MSAPRRDGGFDRRTLLRASLTAAGGLLLRTSWAAAAAEAVSSPGTPAAFAPNGYLRIDPDGTVTLFAPNPDMGQGTRTSMPMVVAGELDVPWSSVRVVPASLDPRAFPEGQGAGGSDSLISGWEPLRRAGAAARTMLVEAAAARWAVPADACSTEAGHVRHAASGRALPYAALLAEAAARPVPQRPALRPVAALAVVGGAVGGVDVPAIVVGRPLYGLDVRLPPATLRAAIDHAPRHGARFLGSDERAALAVPGVRRVLEIPGLDNPTQLRRGFAVLADTTWAALRGKQALAARWEDSAAPEDDSTTLGARFRALVRESGTPLRVAGDVEAALARATHSVDLVYEAPFLAHATLEPQNCTAWVRDGRCDVWGPLQQPGGARRVAAKATGLPEEAIAVHPTRIGGGFGRRLMSDLAAEAAFLSQAAGAPVQVVWSREDDFAHDYYRPAGVHRLRAGLDAQGRVVAWNHRIANVSRNAYRRDARPPESTEVYGLFSPHAAPPAAAQTASGEPAEASPAEALAGDARANADADWVPFRVPHVRVEYTAVPTAIATGAWRAPAHCVNAFVLETALDELAQLGGRDPLALRREVYGSRADFPGLLGHYDPDRAHDALAAAAARIGLGRPLPRGRGVGIAGHFTFSSYAAVAVEVEVDAAGAITVRRAVAAVDCGLVVNRLGAEAQAEGGVLDGLGSSLFGEITVRAGRAEQRNFDGYRLLRLHEAPPVEVVLLEHHDDAPRGLGEITLPPTAPALANAIHAACGVRVRTLPIAPALAAARGAAARPAS